MPRSCFWSLSPSGFLAAQQASSLPARPDSLKFAVIGDNGTGDTPEYDVGTRMS